MYGNHGLGQILNQAFAAARRAGNPARVGLPRRIGIELQIRARDLRFGRPADEQVVHLRVARQLVEVERLQRRQPARVERDVANRTAGRAAPAATAPAAPPLKRTTMSRISSCGRAMISGRSGTSANFSCAAGAIGSAVAGVAANLQVLRGDLVAEQRRVVLERLVHLRVGHPHPPGEERVVAVVEVEPLGRDRPQLLDGGRAERRLLAVHPRRRGRQARDLLRDVGDRRGGALGVHVLDADARLDELDDLRRERRHRDRLGHRQRLGVEPREVGRDRRLEAVEIGFRCRGELRRVEACERRLPVRVEALQARDARRRERHERRRSGRGPGLSSPRHDHPARHRGRPPLA